MNPSFDTNRLRDNQRLDHWRQAVNHAFTRLEILPQRSAKVDCQVSWQDVGHSRIVHVRGTPQVVCRTDEQIDTDALAHIILMFHHLGYATLVHQGRSVHLSPGAVVAMDTRSPYQLVFHGPFEQRIFRFPAQMVCGERSSDSFAATLLPSGYASQVLLAGLNYAESAPSLPNGAEKPLIDLARLALLQNFNLSEQTPAQRLNSVRSYIDAHLDDPVLSSSNVARALGLSLRSMQKLFAQENDQASAYILRQRLHRVQEQLAAPELRHLSIWHIAARWGFNDASHFSRLFKQHVGMTPRSYRLTR